MTVVGAVGIRPAENEDRERVQRLWDDCGVGRIAADEWDALMAAPTTAVLLAEDGDELVGTAITSFDGWRAYIYHVAVEEKHRRLGIGYDLMAQAEQFLLGAGARYVHVAVHQENTEGLALVGSLGYLPEGEIVLTKGLATRL